jgi:hypothetical protein
MNMQVNYERVTEPTVFITKNRQRVKQYGNTVYLKDGEEFELELFNPLTYKVLAKIKLNGNYLESGIVMRPGERVFLERHINEAKKFVFEIYTVDKNDPNVQRAIADNGDVEVEFYSESFNQPIIYTNIWTTPPNFGSPSWTVENPSVFYCSSGDNQNLSGDITFTSSAASYTANIGVENKAPDYSLKKSMETGRIEKGGHSNQALQYDSTSFLAYYTWRKTWKILPVSQKVYVKEDLSVYCTNCGAKRKKDSFKFCPHCGNKY